MAIRPYKNGSLGTTNVDIDHSVVATRRVAPTNLSYFSNIPANSGGTAARSWTSLEEEHLV